MDSLCLKIDRLSRPMKTFSRGEPVLSQCLFASSSCATSMNLHTWGSSRTDFGRSLQQARPLSPPPSFISSLLRRRSNKLHAGPQSRERSARLGRTRLLGKQHTKLELQASSSSFEIRIGACEAGLGIPLSFSLETTKTFHHSRCLLLCYSRC